MRWILAVLALFAICALPASAKGKPTPLTLGTAPYNAQHTLWIEQQDDWPQPEDFIRNSLGTCAWSVDDHIDWLAGGYLDAGASASTQTCIVSDFNPVYATRFGTTAWWNMAPYGFFGVSASPGIDISVCYSPQGRCFTAPSSFCGRANYRPDDPALGDIADSHGGRGIVTTITLTVSNPTSRRIRDIIVHWGISSDVTFPYGCAGPQQEHSEYPFSWSEE